MKLKRMVMGMVKRMVMILLTRTWKSLLLLARNLIKRKADIILEKPNKKPKSSTGVVIHQNTSKISESAQAFVVARFGG
jgi:hypothetical protein